MQHFWIRFTVVAAFVSMAFAAELPRVNAGNAHGDPSCLLENGTVTQSTSGPSDVLAMEKKEADKKKPVTVKKKPAADKKKPEVKKEEKPTREPDVIFVPTPQDVVDKMLELVQLKKEDLVYDLGCGDGRIVVTAAQKYGCKCVGYDIDPKRIKESLENVEKNKVGDLVRIEQKDIFTLDLSKANVITLYLLPSLNVKLIPQLEKLKPGSRIVSHDFDMKGVKPDQVVEIKSEKDSRDHTVYLWTVPLKKEVEKEEKAKE